MSERERVWRERIEWQPWSGQTVAEYCEEAGISVASFYRWKRLLAESRGTPRQRAGRRSAGTSSSGLRERTSRFVPIAVRASSAGADLSGSRSSESGSSLRIELPNGVVIHAAGDLDGQRLGDVIIAAGQIPAQHAGSSTANLQQPEVVTC